MSWYWVDSYNFYKVNITTAFGQIKVIFVAVVVALCKFQVSARKSFTWNEPKNKKNIEKVKNRCFMPLKKWKGKLLLLFDIFSLSIKIPKIFAKKFSFQEQKIFVVSQQSQNLESWSDSNDDNQNREISCKYLWSILPIFSPSRPVWPYWAIFDSCWRQFFKRKWPK